jgi:MinD-like ATPase involved in chromosome partitioning or flagellar assembly
MAEVVAPEVQAQAATRRGRVILVTGGSTSPGVTSVALHLAVAVATMGRNTILADCDPDGGFIAHWLKKRSDKAVDILVRTTTFGDIDPTHVRKACQEISPNLRLVAGFEDPGHADNAALLAPRRLLDALASECEVLIIDGGRLRQNWTGRFFPLADQVLFVLRPDRTGALRLTQSWMADWVRSLAPTHAFAVINGIELVLDAPGFRAALQRDFNLPVAAEIPRSDKAFNRALARNQIVEDPAYLNAIAQLTETLFPAPAREEEEKGGLLGFLRRR